MKINTYVIFVLVIALQSLCFGGKLKIEGTEFDLRATTTCQPMYISGNTVDATYKDTTSINGVKLYLYEVGGADWKWKKPTLVRSVVSKSGTYEFCGLDEYTNYIITAYHNNYKAMRYCLDGATDYNDSHFNILLYRKGKFKTNNQIVGYVVEDGYPLDNAKVTIQGARTKHKEIAYTDFGDFYFGKLKPDTYTLNPKPKIEF